MKTTKQLAVPQHAAPVEFEQMFANGLKRETGELFHPPLRRSDIMLNLGAGNNHIHGTISLGMPEWEAPYLSDYADESVAAVHAHHFLEHLSFEDAMRMLTEIDRVLVPFGVANITVPHGQTSLGIGALDHRTFWTEMVWQRLFYGENYDGRYGINWDLNICYMVVAGINFHELCVLVQLIKDPEYKSLWTSKR